MGSRPCNLVRDLRYLLLGNLAQLVLRLLQPLYSRVHDVVVSALSQIRELGPDQLSDLVRDITVESPRPADTPEQTLGLAFLHLCQCRLHQPVVAINQGSAKLAPMRLVSSRFEQVQNTRDYALRLAHCQAVEMLDQPEECLRVLAVTGQRALERCPPLLWVLCGQLLLDDSPAAAILAYSEDSPVQLVPVSGPCAEQRLKETSSFRKCREIRVCFQHNGTVHPGQFAGIHLLP